MKAKILYYLSEDIVILKDKKITEDGGTIHWNKKKDFDISNAKPLIIKVPNKIFWKKNLAFYGFTWNKSTALNLHLNNNENDGLTHYSPESQKAISEGTSLKTLMTLKDKAKIDILMYAVIFTIVGYLLGSQLPLSGFIGG